MITLLNKIYHRWNVTRQKLIPGHQSRKWYLFFILFVEYFIDYLFVRPIVDMRSGSECWMDFCTQLAGKMIRWFIDRWSGLILKPTHGVP